MSFVNAKQRGEFFATHPKRAQTGAGYHAIAQSKHLGMQAPSMPTMTHPAGQMGVTGKLVTAHTPNYATLGGYLDGQPKL